MKKLLLLLPCFLVFVITHAQTSFEHSYQFWNQGEGNEAFADTDGYVMIGSFDDYNYTERGVFIMKLNLVGDTMWIKNYYHCSYVHSAVKDHEGNIYVPLHYYTDSSSLLKFSPNWELLWERKYNPELVFKKLAVTADNNLLAVGDAEDVRLMKLNSSGDILWNSLPILYSPFGILRYPSLLELENGDIIVITTWVFGTWAESTNSLIRHFNNVGDSISVAAFNSNAGYNLAQVKTVGNDLLGIANCDVFFSNCNANSLVKFKTDGTILWENTLQTSATTNNILKFVISSDNKIITCGTSASVLSYDYKLTIGLFTMDGDSISNFENGIAQRTYPYSMTLCDDGGVLIAGVTGENSGDNYYPYLAKTDMNGNILTDGEKAIDLNKIVVYPNPSITGTFAFKGYGVTGMKVIISDLSGRQCDEFMLTSEKVLWQTNGLTPGVYFYKVVDIYQHSINHPENLNGKLIIQ